MDKFITITSNKRNKYDIEDADFYTNTTTVREIQKAIDQCEVICVWGACGVGKTFIVDHLTKCLNCFEFNSDCIRSKSATLDILEKLKESSTHIIIDDFDYENTSFKEIIEQLNEGKKLTRSSIIFIATSPNKFEKIKSFEIKSLSVNELVRLGRDTFPNKKLPEIIESAKNARGNVRDFISYLKSSDRKDNFKTPKGFVHDLLCSDARWPENPMAYVGQPVEEHGYSWGIVHENYPDSSEIDDCYSEIADWMSQADVVDNLMYEGDWDVSKIFSMYAIVMPAIRTNHSLLIENMRPGSFWTKYNNFRMRHYKIKTMSHRKPGLSVKLDDIQLIHQYCHHDQEKAKELFRTYGLNSTDLDVMNHVCFKNKLKPRVLNKLKKELKNELQTQEKR